MVGALDESDRHSQRGGNVVNRPIGPRDIGATATRAPGIGSRAVTSEGRTGCPTDLIEMSDTELPGTMSFADACVCDFRRVENVLSQRFRARPKLHPLAQESLAIRPIRYQAIRGLVG